MAAITMNNAMLGANAPNGASSEVAIQHVSAAATNTPTNASTRAAPDGETGTTAARKVCGARVIACPSEPIVAREGTPSTLVVGWATSAESQTPTTATIVSRIAGCTWCRRDHSMHTGGATAASTISNS